MTVGIAAYDGGYCTQENATQAEETFPPEESPVCSKTLPEFATECPKESALPIVPPGRGTVIEYVVDAEGKVFYTIMTADKHVFYLIIDHDKNSQNVYLLDTVTIPDLASLADEPLPVRGGANKPKATETYAPDPTPTPEQSGGGSNTGIIALIAVVVALVGATVWFFTARRPKQSAPRNEEYSLAMNNNADEDDGDWNNEEEDASRWTDSDDNDSENGN